jgi:hypothetical protein
MAQCNIPALETAELQTTTRLEFISYHHLLHEKDLQQPFFAFQEVSPEARGSRMPAYVSSCVLL